MRDDVTQPIRDALSRIEGKYPETARVELAAECNPAAMTALLARLDAAEKMPSTVKEIVMSELDSNGQAEWMCRAIDQAMKDQP